MFKPGDWVEWAEGCGLRDSQCPLLRVVHLARWSGGCPPSSRLTSACRLVGPVVICCTVSGSSLFHQQIIAETMLVPAPLSTFLRYKHLFEKGEKVDV